jgi:glycosyltransferase involved in cell wall biosynthesis
MRMSSISVVIPTYNRAHTLRRALDSVLAQTWPPSEILVVDDGSTDGTPDLLKSYGDRGVRVIKTRNQGVSHARNRGVEACTGDWIAFLDSDDEWLPQKLEKQLEVISATPQISLIHGEEIWIRRGVRVNPMNKHQKKGGDVFPDAVRLCCISPSTALIRKELFVEKGGFREDFPVCEDYDLWLKITAHHRVGFVKEPIIKKYGGHDDQLSRQFFAMDFWRVLSLWDVVQSNISSQKRQLALSELQKKCPILLHGYRKHSNLKDYDRIFSIFHDSLGFDPHPQLN